MFIIFFLLLLFTTPALASECSLYETTHPSMILNGAHLSTGKCTTCAFCHINGVFMGTPNTCYLCHAAKAVPQAMQWSTAHIPTGVATCGPVPGGCHTTTAFTPVSTVTMNHTLVAALRCDTCHRPRGQTCTYSSYNAQCQPNDHPTTGTVNGVKNTPLLGVDCNSSGCHTTTTFNK